MNNRKRLRIINFRKNKAYRSGVHAISITVRGNHHKITKQSTFTVDGGGQYRVIGIGRGNVLTVAK